MPMRPNTSQPVVPIFEQRIQDTRGKLQRRLLESRGRVAFARPDQSSTDLALERLGIILSTGRDKSCDGHPAVENLDLTPAPNFIEVARQIRLQLGDRCGCH